MTSILSVNDDCLHRIISYLRDPRSFHSIALTCKRFLQVTENTRSVLHSSLLGVKAEYYIKSYLVDISHGKRRDRYEKYCRLNDLLRDATRVSEGKGTLTYAKVIDVWERNGPVAAKLFTWIRKQASRVEDGEPRATCTTQYRSINLHLPNCKKSMVIKTKYFRDYIHNYDPELSIHVTCGDLDVKSEGFTNYLAEDYMYWGKEDVCRAVQPMKAAIDLLQKELGETNPLITDHFFIWLCYFFPNEATLYEESKLYFKDPVKNIKPTRHMIQSAINLFREDQQIESMFQDIATKWINDETEESGYSKIIGNAVALLVQRSETEILESLERDVPRFYQITSDYDLKLLPKKLLLDLVLRTSLEPSDYSPGSVADKCVENKVYYRCLESKEMKARGWMYGDGASYPTWDRLEMEFTLPNGSVLKLEAQRYRGEEKTLAIENLAPVTCLLQQCINQNVEGDNHTHQISNLLTAVYFLRALEFSEASGTFLGSYTFKDLILRESEKESSSEAESEP